MAARFYGKQPDIVAAITGTSHGLDQYRLDGAGGRNCGFSQSQPRASRLSQGHGLLSAGKGRSLRTGVATGGAAILNMDSPESAEIAAIATRRGLRTIRFGTAPDADLRLIRHERRRRSSLTIAFANREYSVELPLIGAFQAANALAASAIVIASGSDAAEVFACLPALTGVRGRLEIAARHPNAAPIFVDYAHKADALETVLTAVRPHVVGAVHLVFGCGGDRDTGKRPIMGRTAANLADHVYVTDDNPRSEEPAKIRAEIIAACPGATEIGDRALAISTAIKALREPTML